MEEVRKIGRRKDMYRLVPFCFCYFLIECKGEQQIEVLLTLKMSIFVKLSNW